jgi:PAS domain S-box-containing protein
MEKRTILIVDDEPANLSVLSHVLSPTYQVRACKSGEQALQVAAKQPHPDLILLDVMMPGMDGYTVLSKLQEDEHTRDLPVIFVTAMGDETEEEKGLRLGAVDYITKPIRPAIVLARIGAHLEIKQARDLLCGEIEERKKAQQALRDAQQMLQSVLDTIPVRVFWKDLDSRFLGCNRPFALDAGLRSPEELIGRDDFEMGWAEQAECFRSDDRLVMATGRPKLRYEEPQTAPDGKRMWLRTNKVPLLDAEGKIKGVLGTYEEITARKRTEEELEQHKKILQRIIDKSHTHLVYLDPDFNFVAVNTTYAQTCNRAPEELIGRNHFHFYPHEENEAIFRQVRETGKAVAFHDKPFIFPDQPERGTTYWDWTLTPVKDESDKVEGLVFSLVETTERKRAEDALRESQAWLHLALRSAHMGSWYWDLAESRRHFDDRVGRLLGIDPTRSVVSAEEFLSLVHPDDHEKIRAAMAHSLEQDEPYQIEYQVIWRDGSVHHIASRGGLVRDDHGRPLRLNGIVWDVTEQKRAEEERKQWEDRLQQARKAESLGRMAAAIAHNFNNLFGVVMGRLELAVEDLPQGSEAWEDIAQAVVALGRATKISRLMLAYLGQSVGKKEAIDLSEICRESMPLLTTSLPEMVRLKLELAEDKAVVRADSLQITEVLSNLVVNAGEAMGDREGDVTLTVRVIPATDIRTTSFNPPDWEPRDENYACLSVCDSGSGMDKETIEKAFDPFFSTKFTGRGLGLAVVLGIVKAHKGALTVESVPGGGAVFHVFLPLAEVEPLLPLRAEPTDTVSRKDRGLVLLVDDEPMLRSLVSTRLKRLGYAVITAADGVEALEVFREHQERVQCVLLDLAMPRMGGWETLAELRALRPAVAVILSSGYDEGRVRQSYHSEQPQVFLAKPYKAKDLEKALETALKTSFGVNKGDS